MSPYIQEISYKNISLKILRLDIINPEIQGNKYFKLKHNLKYAIKNDYKKILTFGGEYSNHIYSTSIAGLKYDLKTIGIIRGNKPKKNTCTIEDVINNKMEIFYLNRTDYRLARKYINNGNEYDFNSLLIKNNININLKDIYIIPEGGTNKLAIDGTSEILNYAKNEKYNTVCVPVGSGGTIIGLIGSLKKDKRIIGFPALKGNFFENDIKRILFEYKQKEFNNWILNHNYHFKGFGAYNTELIDFVNKFYTTFKIPICTLYTGKMFYGIFDMIDKGEFSSDDILLVIHTGGTQGINAFNEKNGSLLII